MKTIDHHMAWQLLKTALLTVITLSVPLVLISLNSKLPMFSISWLVLAPMLLAIFCIIIFHTLPVLVALAAVWAYARFWSEGIIVTLHMAGRSRLAVAAPALALALACVLAGFAISGFLKPASERAIHDALHDLRRSINLNLIEFGRFNTFDNGNVIVFIKKRLNENLFEGIYVSDSVSKENQATYREHYYAKYALLSENEGKPKLVLFDGSVLNDSAKDRRLYFKYATWQPNGALERAVRTKGFYDELMPGAFFAARDEAFERAGSAGLWLREAVKRVLFPLLSFSYVLLGLGLLNQFGVSISRKGNANLILAMVSAALFAVHLVFVSVVEAISVQGLPFALLAAALFAAQLVAGLVIFLSPPISWLQADSLLPALRLPRFLPRASSQRPLPSSRS